LLIEVPPLLPESDQLTVFGGLLVPETMALNRFVEPRLTLVEEGVTAIVVTVDFEVVGFEVEGVGFGVGLGVGFAGVDEGMEAAPR
jgi:hypothetical protein